MQSLKSGGDDGSSSIAADRARAKTLVYYAFEGIGVFLENMPHDEVFDLDSAIACIRGSKEKSGDKITFTDCVVYDGSDQYTMSGYVNVAVDATPWSQYAKSAKVDIDLDITGDCWHNKIKSDHPYGYGIGDSVGQKEKYQDIDLRINEDGVLYRYHGFKVEIIGDSVEFDGLVTVESSGLYESLISKHLT